MPEHKKRYVIWSFLADKAESESIDASSTGVEISSDTDTAPSTVNSSVKYLVDTNLVSWQRSSQAEPYVFSRGQDHSSRAIRDQANPRGIA